MNGSNGKQVLISGASFAGLSCAFWMSELGYDVTVVERAPGIRSGGTAVNIEGNTVDIARRMGILDAIRANRLDLRRWDFKLADGRTARSLVLREDGQAPSEDEYEIERDVLMRMPAWSKGRVALVGDAAYCPSPAAGLGGSLAIDGAAALGEAMRTANGDHALAFQLYDRNLRPFIAEVQARAVRMLETLVPRTEEAIRARNAKTEGGF